MTNTREVRNARVGRIRPRRRFPVYVAREKGVPSFCGHQHTDAIAARNCAMNGEARTRTRWEVWRVKTDGSETLVRFP